MVPAVVGPVEEEGEDAVAEGAVEATREAGMHGHHEGNEGVDAEEDAEHTRRDDAHEFEIHLSDQRAGVHCRCEGAEDADFVAEIGTLLFRQRYEGLGGALGVADQTQLLETCF